MIERQQLNPYWCAHHWKSYATSTQAAQELINRLAPMQLWTLREFKDAVLQKRQRFGDVKDIPKLVIVDWTTVRRLSVCCILGDDVMDRLKRSVSRELGVPL